ncbi:hypothetical protein SADFL11_00007440 [Roseibium alexandrii DFL-11]|jgi:hypothetical protein|uniref:Uncharacterized protein n=1 Tax=Roseibium alexandrii (strain DSM 17067 / NCIMB 14079 / DFL-11) TaxID=244592 RepID=A0A5E8UWP5_ROSAD|nr:hypothetical protein SADFL11_00007440 [Roseibium alexandrii DFL-11]
MQITTFAVAGKRQNSLSRRLILIEHMFNIRVMHEHTGGAHDDTDSEQPPD